MKYSVLFYFFFIDFCKIGINFVFGIMGDREGDF